MQFLYAFARRIWIKIFVTASSIMFFATYDKCGNSKMKYHSGKIYEDSNYSSDWKVEMAEIECKLNM